LQIPAGAEESCSFIAAERSRIGVELTRRNGMGRQNTARKKIKRKRAYLKRRNERLKEAIVTGKKNKKKPAPPPPQQQ
jgi:hypothetical protein